MHAVSRDIKNGRNSIPKSNRRSVGDDKVTARRQFRARLKAADRRYDFDGYIAPVFTEYDIT